MLGTLFFFFFDELAVGERERDPVVVGFGVGVVCLHLREDVLQLAVAAVLVPRHLVDLVLRGIDVRADQLLDPVKSLRGGHRVGFARAAAGQ